METAIILNLILSNILFFCFIILFYYIFKKTKENEVSTIQELTKSLLSNNLEEYVDSIDDEPIIDPILEEDELEDIDNMDERILIKNLNKEYENNKRKN